MSSSNEPASTTNSSSSQITAHTLVNGDRGMSLNEHLPSTPVSDAMEQEWRGYSANAANAANATNATNAANAANAADSANSANSNS
jgi:hypothetical protein